MILKKCLNSTRRTVVGTHRLPPKKNTDLTVPLLPLSNLSQETNTTAQPQPSVAVNEKLRKFVRFAPEPLAARWAVTVKERVLIP